MDTTASGHPTALWIVRVAALAHLALLLWEGATAGQFMTTNPGGLPLHYLGAFGVHAAAGVQVLAAAWLWWGAGRGPGGARTLLLVSAVAFVLGFPQAAMGSYGPIQAHVPVALLLTGVAVWAAVLAWRRTPASQAS